MKRIDGYLAIMADFRRLVYRAQRATNRSYESKVAAEKSAWTELFERVEQLRRRCLTGEEFHRRDAAIVLAQVFLSFHPFPDPSWLGLPEYLLEGFKGILRHQIEGMRDLETVERIAMALGEIQRLYTEFPVSVSAFDEAVGCGGLVIREEPRTVYWNGDLIDVDWEKRYKKPWTLLWLLAVKAQHGRIVEVGDVYEGVVGRSTMPSLWQRLESLLPGELTNHVEPGSEPSSYQLKLDRSRLSVFRKT